MNVTMKSSDWLSRKQAADYLSAMGCPISHRTLANLAAGENKRGGPPFVRFRWKSVRYARRELEIWAGQQGRRVA